MLSRGHRIALDYEAKTRDLLLDFVIRSYNQYHSGTRLRFETRRSEMSSSALESFAFWTGIATVGVTLVGVLYGGLYFWVSSKTRSLNEDTGVADESKTHVLTGAIFPLQQPANWTGKISVGFMAAGAIFGCLSWWSSSTVSDMKEEVRLHFEREYAARIEVAESEVSKARQKTEKALTNAAAANKRVEALEMKAAGLRERTAQAEHMSKAAEAQSEEAKKEAARADEGTAKALADTAAAKERAGKLEVEAAALRERAARAESELMKVKGRIKRRTISDAQRARLLQDLKPIPRGPIKIIAVMGDEEAGRFAGQISDILKEAGWDEAQVSPGIFGGNINSFEIRIRDREKVPRFALQIAQAFHSIRFEPIIVVDRSVAEGAIEIVVGMKPDSE